MAYSYYRSYFRQAQIRVEVWRGGTIQNRITGIIGPKGSGKSYKAAEIMSTAIRAAVFQIVLEDAAYLKCATDIFDGELKRFVEALGEDTFRYVYRIGEATSNVIDDKLAFPDFDCFVRACFYRKDMMMIVDEAHLLCTARSCPTVLWESVITGRHKALDIVYVGQRFAMITRDITANTDEFYFWQVVEPLDLDAIAKRCGDEVANAVANLRRTDDQRHNPGGVIIPGELLHWTALEGIIPAT